MYTVNYTTRMRKDIRRVKRRGKDLSKLDLLLVYRIDEGELVLLATATGTHSDISNK